MLKATDTVSIFQRSIVAGCTDASLYTKNHATIENKALIDHKYQRGVVLVLYTRGGFHSATLCAISKVCPADVTILNVSNVWKLNTFQ